MQGALQLARGPTFTCGQVEFVVARAQQTWLNTPADTAIDKHNTMNNVTDGFKLADFSGAFLQRNGPYYIKPEGQRWLIAQRVEKQHVNYLGIAHGGMLSTLADVALSCQPYLSEQPNPSVTTTSMTTNFLLAAKLGDWIVADAAIDRLSKRSAHVRGAITRGDEVLLTMSGVFGIYRPG